MLDFGYQHFIKPLAFRRDPEEVHEAFTRFGHFLGTHSVSRELTRLLFAYDHPQLRRTVAGLTFRNPIGLAAGFDKNALLLDILPAVGFGFAEIGSITAKPCAGNPKPRLWRMPKSEALVVNYGLANDGADVVLQRIANSRFATLRRSEHPSPGHQYFRLGISIAKTNSPDTCDERAGIADYLETFQKVNTSGLADYITINVSCPNAFGGEPFTTPEKFDRLSAALKTEIWNVPIFVKLPCDIDIQSLDAILDLCVSYGYAGVILSNLTKDRLTNPALNADELNRVGKGGISGRPTFEKSNALIAHTRSKYPKEQLAIMGCGGVRSSEDAKIKLAAGADVIQLISGMIFNGPQLIGNINKALVR